MAQVTFTLAERGEIHEGMDVVGRKEKLPIGFGRAELQAAAARALQQWGCSARLVDLPSPPEDPAQRREDACVLVLPGFLERCSLDPGAMFDTAMSLTWDTVFWNRRRQLLQNKHKRANNVIADVPTETYSQKGGTKIPWTSFPALGRLRDILRGWGGNFSELRVAEGNLYRDGGQRHGIGAHGDAERSLVVAVRLGRQPVEMPLVYQWYHRSKAVGPPTTIGLQGGDVYVMSHKAVGGDWLCSSRFTLRHSTGLRAVRAAPRKRSAVDGAPEEEAKRSQRRVIKGPGAGGSLP